AATSPSAMPWTSRGCRAQKAAIWSKLSDVFSTSQTAVALGISSWVVAMAANLSLRRGPGASGPPRLLRHAEGELTTNIGGGSERFNRIVGGRRACGER